jgi:Tfp pilus assembly protein PilF
MAIILCSECGAEISEHAYTCPICGFPQKVQNVHNIPHSPLPIPINNKKLYKSLFYLRIIIVLLCAVLAGLSVSTFNRVKTNNLIVLGIIFSFSILLIVIISTFGKNQFWRKTTFWCKLVIFTAILIFGVFIISNIKPEIDPINISYDLTNTGISSFEMTTQLTNHINNIIREVYRDTILIMLGEPPIQWDYSQIPDFDVPKLGISIKPIINIFKDIFGIQYWHINSEVNKVGDSLIMDMTIFKKGGEYYKRKIITPRSKIDSLYISAAMIIVEQTDPIILISYLIERDDDHAIQIIKNQIELHDMEKCGYYLNLWGGILKKHQQYPEAIDKYKTVIAVSKSNELKALAYNNWGACLSNQGKREEAIKLYKTAIELDNTAWIFFDNLGSSYGEVGNWAEAIKMIEVAIKLNPNLLTTYLRLVEYSLASGDTSKALKAFEKAQKNVKLATENYYHWALILESAHDTTLATEKYWMATIVDNNKDIILKIKENLNHPDTIKNGSVRNK